jgi:hypothetical protein
MADTTKTQTELRELLQNEGLRTKLLNAKDVKDVSRLLNTAGQRRGYKFSEQWVNDLLVDIKSLRWPQVFTEEELLLLASSSMECDTTSPKTCHTDTCVHVC